MTRFASMRQHKPQMYRCQTATTLNGHNTLRRQNSAFAMILRPTGTIVVMVAAALDPLATQKRFSLSALKPVRPGHSRGEGKDFSTRKPAGTASVIDGCEAFSVNRPLFLGTVIQNAGLLVDTDH